MKPITSSWPRLSIWSAGAAIPSSASYRHAHELCLFGVRGKAPAAVHNLSTVIFAPRGKHSAKPEELQDRAELLSPRPRLELFARRPRAGWVTWGNEVREAA